MSAEIAELRPHMECAAEQVIADLITIAKVWAELVGLVETVKHHLSTDLQE